jgi:hypothetical protein
MVSPRIIVTVSIDMTRSRFCQGDFRNLGGNDISNSETLSGVRQGLQPKTVPKPLYNGFPEGDVAKCIEKERSLAVSAVSSPAGR